MLGRWAAQRDRRFREALGREGLRCTVKLCGGRRGGKSRADGRALRAALPPARLGAGACPQAQVGRAQPLQGCGKQFTPFLSSPAPSAGRQPPPPDAAPMGRP